jgi:hypothetical protein
MAWSWTPARRDAPELMDAPGLPAPEVAEAYRVLRRVNRQFFGSLRSAGRELDRLLDEGRRPTPRRASGPSTSGRARGTSPAPSATGPAPGAWP